MQSEVESWQRKRVGRCRRSRSRTHARNVAKHFTGASTLAVGVGGGGGRAVRDQRSEEQQAAAQAFRVKYLHTLTHIDTDTHRYTPNKQYAAQSVPASAAKRRRLTTRRRPTLAGSSAATATATAARSLARRGCEWQPLCIF